MVASDPNQSRQQARAFMIWLPLSEGCSLARQRTLPELLRCFSHGDNVARWYIGLDVVKRGENKASACTQIANTPLHFRSSFIHRSSVQNMLCVDPTPRDDSLSGVIVAIVTLSIHTRLYDGSEESCCPFRPVRNPVNVSQTHGKHPLYCRCENQAALELC